MRKIFIILSFVIINVLMSCGPCTDEKCCGSEIRRKDSIATTTTIDENYGAPVTYYASDFGLMPGVIVRWIPRSIDNSITEATFATVDVAVHVQGFDGVTKVFKADWKAWTNLTTGDTLK